MKIVLIEDNETIVKGLEYAFINQGYQFALTLSTNINIYR